MNFSSKRLLMRVAEWARAHAIPQRLPSWSPHQASSSLHQTNTHIHALDEKKKNQEESQETGKGAINCNPNPKAFGFFEKSKIVTNFHCDEKTKDDEVGVLKLLHLLIAQSSKSTVWSKRSPPPPPLPRRC
jgi:hypothetical protein